MKERHKYNKINSISKQHKHVRKLQAHRSID